MQLDRRRTLYLGFSNFDLTSSGHYYTSLLPDLILSSVSVPT